MIQTIYYIILGYFILGGLGFYLINRKKEPAVAKKSYTKFISYFFIIHILFFSIAINPIVFRGLSVVIIGMGLIELIRLFKMRAFANSGFFVGSLVVFAALSLGFFHFGALDKELILFAFLVLSIFDSFSQISGQLWGKTKILPEISPNKTLGGLVGGALFAVASAFILNDLYDGTLWKSVVIAAGVVVFAFLGDIAASYYKRKFQVKDYSQLIPGHGGFLDRFDSLIAGGAWVAFCMIVLNF